MTEQHARRHKRRTTFVSEQAWGAFDAFKAGITGRKGERAVAAKLEALGLLALHDIILPDVLGTTQIDHIVCGADVIIVIETKTYGGRITGAPGDPEWMQHLADGDVRHRFQNPLRQNHRHCQAVKAVLSGLNVPVQGVVISAGKAVFCDALLQIVLTIDQMAVWLAPRHPDATLSSAMNEAWRLLIAQVNAGCSLRDQHRDDQKRFTARQNTDCRD
jgi:hypothetical protein